MAARPTFIDFRSRSQETVKSGISSPGRLPSPRIIHCDGDIPPQMSPLERFTLQSKMLAKKLDESTQNGRRVSRLPPLTINDYFSKSGSGNHRSRSANTRGGAHVSSPQSKNDDSAIGNMPEVEEPTFRPKSFYPQIGRFELEDEVDNEDEAEDRKSGNDDSSPGNQELLTPATSQPQSTKDYFALQRVGSPEQVTSLRGEPPGAKSLPVVGPQPRLDSAHSRSESLRGLSGDLASSAGHKQSVLAPPQSPHIRQAASIRSVPMDSSDDELSTSAYGSSFSQHRKHSSSSGMSAPHSPLSPYVHIHARSPSLNSELSLSGSRLVRPTFNFSRPLSRGSRPSIELNSRQPSLDSRPSFDMSSRQPSSDSQRFVFVSGHVQTRGAVDNEQHLDLKDSKDAPAPSYIYTKFSLPRGRVLQRNSKVLENQQAPHFEWEQPHFQSNVVPVTPPTEDKLSSASQSPLQIDRPSAEYSRPPSRPPSRPSPRPSIEKSPLAPTRPAPTPVPNESQSVGSASMRSGSTIKARLNRPVSPSMDFGPEDHLAKGIESHERGNFKESTYHLRIAARHNLPTAMLLYALACRHGWGMRPNPQEGVQWLRKAADSASLEIADNEDQQKAGGSRDMQQEKARRAQFALSIYELGVSHMNGWGIEQDKALALRCFEIAANWGDADAMAEAGFCFAQGTGCKKDLMKAAKYYRMAEAKGMSMVGNSW
ncbi:MAG: hypothetical protein Q9190_003248 [Brigantiaea leucoxantha]